MLSDFMKHVFEKFGIPTLDSFFSLPGAGRTRGDPGADPGGPGLEIFARKAPAVACARPKHPDPRGMMIAQLEILYC